MRNNISVAFHCSIFMSSSSLVSGSTSTCNLSHPQGSSNNMSQSAESTVNFFWNSVKVGVFFLPKISYVVLLCSFEHTHIFFIC
uniref:Secreted protein n=1 Tax=Taeniopygia guttata TaxID=59729 RepID=A0A674GKL0_TAEGU